MRRFAGIEDFGAKIVDLGVKMGILEHSVDLGQNWRILGPISAWIWGKKAQFRGWDVASLRAGIELVLPGFWVENSQFWDWDMASPRAELVPPFFWG